MVPEYEPGEFAGWIAPPQHGINDQPVEFDYVHFWRQDRLSAARPASAVTRRGARQSRLRAAAARPGCAGHGTTAAAARPGPVVVEQLGRQGRVEEGNRPPRLDELDLRDEGGLPPGRTAARSGR